MTNFNLNIDPTSPQPSTDCEVVGCSNEAVFITLDGGRLCNAHIESADLGENFDFSEAGRD